MLIVAQPPELGVAGSLPGRRATRHAEPRSGDGNPARVTTLRERGRSLRSRVSGAVRLEKSSYEILEFGNPREPRSTITP